MSRVCAAIALALVGDAEEDCDGSTYLTLRLLLAEMNTLSLQGALRKREAWVPNVLHSLLGSAAVDFKLQRRQVNTFFHILGSMPGLHLGADADSRELVLGRVTSQLALFQMPWSTHVSAVLLREVALGGRRRLVHEHGKVAVPVLRLPRRVVAHAYVPAGGGKVTSRGPGE